MDRLRQRADFLAVANGTRANSAAFVVQGRCLSRSIIRSPETSGSGAQALAATRTARSENLAAAGRGETGAEAVTALAHQFAGLISPLHG